MPILAVIQPKNRLNIYKGYNSKFEHTINTSIRNAIEFDVTLIMSMFFKAFRLFCVRFSKNDNYLWFGMN